MVITPVHGGYVMDGEQASRSTISRIGLVALNLPAPGLGLVRLGNLAEGLSFLFGLLVGVLLVSAVLFVAPVISPSGYLAIMAVFLLAALFVYIMSTVRVWRISRISSMTLRWWQKWYALASLYVLATLAGIGVTSVGHAVYKPYYIPAASMEPTLAVDDQLVADMRTGGVLNRGDVIIVKVGNSDYVKRVVGIAGDRIAMIKGVPYINGRPAEQHVSGFYRADNGRARLLEERLPGETKSHRVLDSGTSDLDDFPEQAVPSGRLFLLGDSRDNSADSRVSRELGGLGGTVPQSDIRGRALFKSFDPNYRWIGKLIL